MQQVKSFSSMSELRVNRKATMQKAVLMFCIKKAVSEATKTEGDSCQFDNKKRKGNGAFLKCSRPDLCFKFFQVSLSGWKPNDITIRNTEHINTGVLFSGK